MKCNSKIIVPEIFDRIISVELTDIDKNNHLYSCVVKHIMHGPCGELNLKNICVKKIGTCKNHYPRPFCSETHKEKNSYPIYRR